ncbi:MAG: bifunctional anthranilate synthase component I family protein/class IV aminotransferase [Acidimicrobiales bacterium]
MMRCRIDHTAAGEKAIELRGLIGELETHRVSDVPGVLADAEDAARRGLFVGGFVAYEAAPAFDAAFRVRAPATQCAGSERLPICWFGLFSEAVPAPDLLPVDRTTSYEHSDLTGWKCEIDPPTYAVAMAQIRQAIAQGYTYLVNYTTRFRRTWTSDDDAFELYRRLVASYAGGYHAFFETDDWAVACGSPELFFEHSNGRLITRPMKGTASRGRWSAEDSIHGEALSTSPKERAENVMVVDLLRNDLGRVATHGTVEVPVLWHLEQHPTAWQLTSTVTAITRDDVGLAEIFGALFPCASVTGAPKVSAMSTIAGLELSRRGLYCGAVGFLEPHPHRAPTARFAVAIRTAVVDKLGAVAEYGSGGGITWESNPEREWDEVLLKAQALDSASAVTLGADEGLIETMAFEPDSDGGVVRNQCDHLERLSASAKYFGLTFPLETEELIAKALIGIETPTRVRLVLRAGGLVEIETFALDLAKSAAVVQLCIDLEPVTSTEVTLFHKTTDRRRYDERSRRHPTTDDVVLVNERGEVTETTRANLAVRIGDRWCTPPLECGLLPGIERARCLAGERLVERVVTVDELRDASDVAVLSSLRGWRPARVVDGCNC